MSRQWTTAPAGKSMADLPPRPLAATRVPQPSSIGERRPGHEFSNLPVLPMRADAHPPDPLPKDTPAWSAAGGVHLAQEAMFADTAKRQDILRHEAIHARQQRSCLTDNSTPSRQRAELAAESGLPLAIGNGVPEVLAYPPQNFSPWQRVWIGYPGIVGEVEAGSVKVRHYMDYGDLAPVKGYWDYFCGPHDGAPIPDLVKEMKGIANLVSSLNATLPAGKHRVDMVIIGGDPSGDGYRYFNGKGLVVLSRDEFLAKNWQGTIRHEVSHGIFEFHAEGGREPGKPGDPDNFALSVADLFTRLKTTREVQQPRKRFTEATPGLAVPEGEQGLPGGMAMVHDTLWSGSGGHPQENVSEFFASANGAYLTDKALLQRMIDFYAAHDPAIVGLGKELLRLLAMVSQPKVYGAVGAPRAKDAAAATIVAAGAVPVFDADHYAFSRQLAPEKMPAPETFNCQPKAGTQPITEDDLLDFEGTPKAPDKGKESPPRPPSAGKASPPAKDKKP